MSEPCVVISLAYYLNTEAILQSCGVWHIVYNSRCHKLIMAEIKDVILWLCLAGAFCIQRAETSMWLLLRWQRQGHPTHDSRPDGPGAQHPQQQIGVKQNHSRPKIFHQNLRFYLLLLLTQSDLWYSCKRKLHHTLWWLNCYMKYNPGFVLVGICSRGRGP